MICDSIATPLLSRPGLAFALIPLYWHPRKFEELIPHWSSSSRAVLIVVEPRGRVHRVSRSATSLMTRMIGIQSSSPRWISQATITRTVCATTLLTGLIVVDRLKEVSYMLEARTHEICGPSGYDERHACKRHESQINEKRPAHCSPSSSTSGRSSWERIMDFETKSAPAPQSCSTRAVASKQVPKPHS